MVTKILGGGHHVLSRACNPRFETALEREREKGNLFLAITFLLWILLNRPYLWTIFFNFRFIGTWILLMISFTEKKKGFTFGHDHGVI